MKDKKKKIRLNVKVSRIMLILMIGSVVACEDFIEVDPPKTGLVSETVFTSDATANAAMSAVYVRLTGSFLGAGTSSIIVLNGFASDELVPAAATNEQIREFYNNNLTPINPNLSAIWSVAYNLIYQSNAIIAGLNDASGVNESLKNQLEGEALFIRAYTHFHLANLFGDIPYITTTDYRENAKASRMLRTSVLGRVVQDLENSKQKLSENYTYSKNERVRVNKWVASAFLARVYLYIGDWDKAEAESNIVINNTALFELAANLDDVFLKNSREAIWQWMPSNSGLNAAEGSYFILTGAPNIASLSLDLVSHFETGDKRKERWMGSFSDGVNTWYFPFKYKQKVPTSASVEYSVVMRLAELYLVRSEARANMNNLTGAVNDLDKLRSRAELPLISDTSPGINKEELLIMIERERRSELFTENHRWYDLIRTGQADVVMTAIKAGWQATDILFPLPESELLINPLLQPQNPGY